MLIVVSGLPGVGKSTLADALGCALGIPVLSVNPIEAAIWRCGIPQSFETGVAAYEVVAVLAEHQILLGLSVIADAVSSVELARDMWRNVAQQTGTPLRVVEVICTDEGLHRERLAGRTRIAGFPEPSWNAVLRRRDEWEPWADDRLVLDTVGDLSVNVGKAVAYVSAAAPSA